MGGWDCGWFSGFGIGLAAGGSRMYDTGRHDLHKIMSLLRVLWLASGFPSHFTNR